MGAIALSALIVRLPVDVGSALLSNERASGFNITCYPGSSGWVALCAGACDLGSCSNMLDYVEVQGTEAMPARPPCASFSPAPLDVLQASYIFAKPIEIVGRFSRLYAPGGTDPKWITEVRLLGQEIATGVNYYLNGHQFKFQADWIVRTTRDATFDSTDHALHVQLDATF